jgi:hypothetical protein
VLIVKETADYLNDSGWGITMIHSPTPLETGVTELTGVGILSMYKDENYLPDSNRLFIGVDNLPAYHVFRSKAGGGVMETIRGHMPSDSIRKRKYKTNVTEVIYNVRGELLRVCYDTGRWFAPDNVGKYYENQSPLDLIDRWMFYARDKGTIHLGQTEQITAQCITATILWLGRQVGGPDATSVDECTHLGFLYCMRRGVNFTTSGVSELMSTHAHLNWLTDQCWKKQ